MSVITREEVRRRLLACINMYVSKWMDHTERCERKRYEGLVGSIFAIFDGKEDDIPMFVLAPKPCSSDGYTPFGRRDALYPELEAFIGCDIAGSLQDEWALLMNESRTPRTPLDLYSYSVRWSTEDHQFMGRCAEFPSLSWLDDHPESAIMGIRRTVGGVLREMREKNEECPKPLGG